MNRKDDLRAREKRGPVAYMARNGVAANLLMAFILLAGIFALRDLVQEVFPEVPSNNGKWCFRHPTRPPY